MPQLAPKPSPRRPQAPSAHSPVGREAVSSRRWCCQGRRTLPTQSPLGPSGPLTPRAARPTPDQAQRRQSPTPLAGASRSQRRCPPRWPAGRRPPTQTSTLAWTHPVVPPMSPASSSSSSGTVTRRDVKIKSRSGRFGRREAVGAGRAAPPPAPSLDACPRSTRRPCRTLPRPRAGREEFSSSGESAEDSSLDFGPLWGGRDALSGRLDSAIRFRQPRFGPIGLGRATRGDAARQTFRPVVAGTHPGIPPSRAIVEYVLKR
jgi:hypothetical protein